MTVKQVENKPTAAFLLSLLGGIIGLIIAAALSAFFPPLGIWGLISSIIVIISASKLNSNPWEHAKWGAVILVFSIIGVGPLLAFLGGILALVYNPKSPTPPAPPIQTTTSAPATSQERVVREEITKTQIIYKIRCSYCGTTYEETLDKCPNCGARTH